MWTPLARTAGEKKLPRRLSQGMGSNHPLLSRPLNLHPCSPPAVSPVTRPNVLKRSNPNINLIVLIIRCSDGIIAGSPNMNYEEL